MLLRSLGLADGGGAWCEEEHALSSLAVEVRLQGVGVHLEATEDKVHDMRQQHASIWLPWAHMQRSLSKLTDQSLLY